MKRFLGIFSLAILIFSIFAPSFTYANTGAENDAIEILLNELSGNLLNGGNERQMFGGEDKKIATLVQGKTFQDILKDMANQRDLGYWDLDYKIEYFLRADSNENMSGERIVSNGEPVYVWFDDSDGTGIVYWYSEADKIYLNSSIEMMFGNLAALKELDLSYFDSVNVGAYPAYNNAFYHTDSLKKLILDGWDFSNFTFQGANSSNFFNYMGDIEYLSMSGCKMPPQSKNFLNYMYNNDLKYLDVTNLDFSNTNDLEYLMYNACGSLETMKGIETWDVSGINNMHGLFQNCSKLETLDLSNFNVNNVTNMSSMFKGMNNLKTIYVSESFNTSKVTSSQEMFEGVTQIIGGNGTTYNEEQIDKLYAKIDSKSVSGYFTDILDREYNIYYVIDDQDNVDTYTPRNGVELKSVIKPGYELEYWYESGHNEPFVINKNTRGDKILYAKWKPLEEKTQETTTEKVVYTNETTVTIGDKVQNESINNSSLINLVSKEVEQHEIKEEDDKTTVQESEIQVTSDKTVEYQGGLEVYLEKTENEETKRIEGTAKFSSPVAVKIPITSKAEFVKVQVKHEGEDFGYTGLTLNPYNECINGEAVSDKYTGENVGVIEINGEKYALIYTCSASTFVAYTENAKPVVVNESTSTPTPSAGGGRIISTTTNKQSTNEPEHSSADAENKSIEQNTTTLTKEIIIDSKLQQRSLTRGEVAVMTNILLDVFPELINGKQEIEDITNACTNYTDEQKFTKDEKKAITRLCKLSIMGIHADNNKPLDEFMVNEWTKNDEFSKVINRSISTYTEKDLSAVKEALKKLEDNEENVEFGTVYNVFMSIKSLFN